MSHQSLGRIRSVRYRVATLESVVLSLSSASLPVLSPLAIGKSHFGP